MNCKKCGAPLGAGVTICAICGEAVESPTPVEHQGQVQTPVSPVVQENAIPNNNVVATQVNNVTPTSQVNTLENNAPVNGGGAPTPSPKNNNKLFIIICAVLVIVILVLVVLIMNNNSSSKDEDKKSDNKTTEKTTTKSSEEDKTTSSNTTTLPKTTVTPTGNENYENYYGLQLYVPDSFVVDNQSGTITYTSITKRQILALQVDDYNYEDVKGEFASYVTSLVELGMTTTTQQESEYKGMKYSLVRGSLSGVQISTGFAEFAKGYTVVFVFRTDYATENEYLETLLQITTNSKQPSSFSKKDSDSASTFVKDSSQIGKDVPKLTIE